MKYLQLHLPVVVITSVHRIAIDNCLQQHLVVGNVILQLFLGDFFVGIESIKEIKNTTSFDLRLSYPPFLPFDFIFSPIRVAKNGNPFSCFMF